MNNCNKLSRSSKFGLQNVLIKDNFEKLSFKFSTIQYYKSSRYENTTNLDTNYSSNIYNKLIAQLCILFTSIDHCLNETFYIILET